MDINAQKKINNWMKGMKRKVNGNVWDIETTIENLVLAKLIFDFAL